MGTGLTPHVWNLEHGFLEPGYTTKAEPECFWSCYTVEPPNNGHVVDECFVHYSEVPP